MSYDVNGVRDPDPNGMITRPHFLHYKAGCENAPPPLHILSVWEPGRHAPLPRPLPGSQGVIPGPALIYGGSGLPCLGVDPTDASTWGGRGYRQSRGMIGRFNSQDDWHGNVAELNPLGMP